MSDQSLVLSQSAQENHSLGRPALSEVGSTAEFPNVLPTQIILMEKQVRAVSLALEIDLSF